MSPSRDDIARELQDWLAPPEDAGFTEAVMRRVADAPAPVAVSAPTTRSSAERWATPVLALCSGLVAGALAMPALRGLPEIALAADGFGSGLPPYMLHAGVAVAAVAVWLAADPDALA